MIQRQVLFGLRVLVLPHCGNGQIFNRKPYPFFLYVFYWFNWIFMRTLNAYWISVNSFYLGYGLRKELIISSLLNWSFSSKSSNYHGYILTSQTVLIQFWVLLKPLTLAHIMAFSLCWDDFIEVHTSLASFAKGEPSSHMLVPTLVCFNSYIWCYCSNSIIYIRIPMCASVYWLT